MVSVESVHFSENIHSKNSGSIPINRVFPLIKSLHLNSYLNVTHIDNLDHYWPHLMHLQTNKFDTECDVTRVIEKNRQIKSFKTDRTTHDYLEKLNSLLPNLKSLALRAYDSGNYEIRFQNVTKFTVLSSKKSTEKLYFPNLKWFCLRLEEPAHLEFWIDFLLNHL